MGAVDLITGVHEDDDTLAFPAVKWQKWFAWYPVTVHGKKEWMKTVYRHKQYIKMQGVGDPLRSYWRYGNIFDVLSQ